MIGIPFEVAQQKNLPLALLTRSSPPSKEKENLAGSVLWPRTPFRDGKYPIKWLYVNMGTVTSQS